MGGTEEMRSGKNILNKGDSVLNQDSKNAYLSHSV